MSREPTLAKSPWSSAGDVSAGAHLGTRVNPFQNFRTPIQHRPRSWLVKPGALPEVPELGQRRNGNLSQFLHRSGGDEFLFHDSPVITTTLPKLCCQNANKSF